MTKLTSTPAMQEACRAKREQEEAAALLVVQRREEAMRTAKTREATQILDLLRNMRCDERRCDTLSIDQEWCLAQFAPQSIHRAHALLFIMDIAEEEGDQVLWGKIAGFIQDDHLTMDNHAIEVLTRFVNNNPRRRWTRAFAKDLRDKIKFPTSAQQLQKAA